MTGSFLPRTATSRRAVATSSASVTAETSCNAESDATTHSRTEQSDRTDGRTDTTVSDGRMAEEGIRLHPCSGATRSLI
jgi:hypothetical protein